MAYHCPERKSHGAAKLRVPKGFFTVMEVFVRELLKNKPLDVFEYGARFFESLLQLRTDTGHDPAVHGARSEDSFFNMLNIKCGKAHGKKGKRHRHKSKNMAQAPQTPGNEAAGSEAAHPESGPHGGDVRVPIPFGETGV